MDEDVRDYELSLTVYDLATASERLTEYLDTLTVPEEVKRELVMAYVHDISEAYIALAFKLDQREKALID